MKQLAIFLTFFLLSTSILFALSDKELAISINLAGKQRMLSQKMTKESFLIRSNIDKAAYTDKLKKSADLFDKTLKGLMYGDSSLKLLAIENSEIQNQLKKVEVLWKPFHKEIQAILSGEAKDQSYAFLEQNNMILLKEMNKAVKMYAAQNKGSSKLTLAKDIDLAGKQRMLTQKMGKDLLFINNDFKTKTYMDDFHQSQTLFTKTLDGLFHGSKDLNLTGTNLPKITNQLKIVQKLWEEHQETLDNALKKKDLKKAINGLDTILVEMNKAVIYYTQSINRQKQRLRFDSIVSSFMKKKDVLKKRVNLSGRQRMLTQRMTKLALLVHFKINQKENRERLIQYSDLYNQTLLAFKNGDKSTGCIPSKEKDILEQITVIEKEWKPFYKHIKRIIDGKDLDGKSLKYLVDNNEQLLAASNELVKRYEKSDKLKNYLEKARLHVVNVAGRQRMLTQKMTKEKLLIVNGESQYQEKLKKSISLFDSSLKALIQGDPEHHIIKPSNKKIKKQLAVVADMWKKLKPLYENAKPTTKELKTIINENPVLLVEMDKMVKMSEVELDY